MGIKNHLLLTLDVNLCNKQVFNIIHYTNFE